jgi:hypothetical protein
MPESWKTEAPPIEVTTRESAIVQQKKTPLAVVLIAVLQFARAGVILFVVLCTWLFPDANLTSRPEIKVLVYVAAAQNLPAAILVPVVMPAVALSLLAVGLGLWFLKSWARKILMLTSGITAVLWIRRFFFDAAFGNSTFQTDLGRQTVYFVVLLDSLVFCCLAFLPDITEAFGKRE